MYERRKEAGRLEIFVLVFLFVLSLLVRVVFLQADPPRGLSTSTDVYTDPPQYTHFARQYVLDGDLDTLHDHRFPLFVQSSVTLLAVAVFRLFGTGLWQSHLVGVLYALGAILLFSLFLRRLFGRGAAVTFLLLAGCNYNLIFYGRLPFLEHAMAFHAFLALVLLVYSRRSFTTIVAGAALAVGVFYSKMIGMVFLFPFGLLLVWQAYHDEASRSWRRWLRPLLFLAGFLFVFGCWYLFVYIPAQGQVASYLAEKSIALYGTPKAFQSVDDFLFQMVSFGRKEMLFSRMPLAAILAAAFIVVFVCRFEWHGNSSESGGALFICATIAAFYGSLMIWNYRPLRYQLVLIYPILGAASIVLAGLWSRWRTLTVRRIPAYWYLSAFLLMMILSYQFGKGLAESFDFSFFWSEYSNLLVTVSFAGTVIAGLTVIALKRQPWRLHPLIARVIVIALVIPMTAFQAKDYMSWVRCPTFTARDYSRDLGRILSPQAVLSGPFGPLLASENRLHSLIHMFGVTVPDSDLFREFPVTHLLVDGMNESRARRDYPDLIKPAPVPAVFQVGEEEVKLLRIAGLTGNVEAEGYRLSQFELAEATHRRQPGLVRTHRVERLLDMYPNSLTIHFQVGQWAEIAELYDMAEKHLEKAVEISPTNYVLKERLAEYYEHRYAETSDSSFRAAALRWYEHAIEIAPDDATLTLAYDRLKGKVTWQKSPDTTSSSLP